MSVKYDLDTEERGRLPWEDPTHPKYETWVIWQMRDELKELQTDVLKMDAAVNDIEAKMEADRRPHLGSLEVAAKAIRAEKARLEKQMATIERALAEVESGGVK